MSELATEKLYRKELQNVGGKGKSNIERIRSLSNTTKAFEVADVKALTTEQCESLNCGDVVIKNESGSKHTYVVTYKQDDEMCITYVDHQNAEEVYYEKHEGNWGYIQTDNTELVSKTYVDTLMSGALKRAIVEELPTTDIDTNTIYMVLDETASSGNVYNEYLYIENAWELIGTTAMETPHLYRHHLTYKETGEAHQISVTVYTNSSAVMSYSDLSAFLIANGYSDYSQNGYSDVTGCWGNDPDKGMFEITQVIFLVIAITNTGTIIALTMGGNKTIPNTITFTDTVSQIF